MGAYRSCRECGTRYVLNFGGFTFSTTSTSSSLSNAASETSSSSTSVADGNLGDMMLTLFLSSITPLSEYYLHTFKMLWGITGSFLLINRRMSSHRIPHSIERSCGLSTTWRIKSHEVLFRTITFATSHKYSHQTTKVNVEFYRSWGIGSPHSSARCRMVRVVAIIARRILNRTYRKKLSSS